MDRREELKAKARDHERNDQPEHALEIYMGLAAESSSSGLGGLWGKIGALQEKIGGVANAVDSYSRSATAFSDAGQLNNAIAVTERLLRLDPDDSRAHLRRGELSLAQGLRVYARSGIGEYARQTAASDTPEDAVVPLAAFLGRFPDESDIWRDLEEGLLALGKVDRALPVLERLCETLAREGHSDAAERLALETERLRANDEAGSNDDALEEYVDGDSPSIDIPLLGLDGSSGKADAPTIVAPIEGLESTGGESYAPEGAEGGDVLPLLENFPGLDGDDDDPEGCTAPLPGVEHFGVEGDDESVSDRSSEVEDVAHSDADADTVEGGHEDLPLLAPDQPGREPAEVTVGADNAHFDPAHIVGVLCEHAGIDIAFTDAASHYDLGLAYKEMDRYDESVANLAMALQGGRDPATVLEVVGEILVQRGEYSLTDDLLRRVPGVGDHPMPEHLGVHYWLARAAEESGRPEEARRTLERVVAVDPDFRDAAVRLRNLL